MPRASGPSVPKQMQAAYDAVVAITDRFAAQHLDQEYAALAREMAAALARKRPSPLGSGKPESWAGGIIYAVGQINFLFDKSQTPHLRGDQIGPLLGLAASTVANKAKAIRDALRISNWYDTRFMRRRMIDQNPLVWMIEVDGFLMDARQLPEDVQAELVDRGVIPYVASLDDAREG